MAGSGEPFPDQPAPQDSGVSELSGTQESHADPLVSAISILKQIFDSGNQSLIQAVTLNLRTCQHALQTTTELSRQSSKLDALKDQLQQYQERLQAIEDQTKAG